MFFFKGNLWTPWSCWMKFKASPHGKGVWVYVHKYLLWVDLFFYIINIFETSQKNIFWKKTTIIMNCNIAKSIWCTIFVDNILPDKTKIPFSTSYRTSASAQLKSSCWWYILGFLFHLKHARYNDYRVKLSISYQYTWKTHNAVKLMHNNPFNWCKLCVSNRSSPTVLLNINE